MVVRKIVKIGKARCDGCGLCIPQCAEGDLQIINGKARLIEDRYCDGLGAHLGQFPQGGPGEIRQKHPHPRRHHHY